MVELHDGRGSDRRRRLERALKAAVYHGRRDVRVEEVAEPGPPAPGEVLLRVTRAAICGTDAAEWANGPHLIPPGRSLVLGHEFTGTVVAAGDGVGSLAGTRVVPGAGMWCGDCDACRAGRTNLCRSYYTLGLQADGGLAEYALAPARMCVPVPDGCTDDAAATAQPLAVALPEALDVLARGELARVIVDRVVPLESFVTDGLAPLAAAEVDGKVLVAPARA